MTQQIAGCWVCGDWPYGGISDPPHELKLAIRGDEGYYLVGLIRAQVDTLHSSSSAVGKGMFSSRKDLWS